MEKYINKIKNMERSTLILILLPIISVCIGYFGVKFYLLSNNQYNDEPINEIGNVIDENASENNDNQNDSEVNSENNKGTMTTSNIGPIEFYSIQCGAFSNMENATTFKNNLLDQGINAFILKSNNYKVFAFVSLNKDSLTDRLEMVRKEVGDAFIKQVNIISENKNYYTEQRDPVKLFNESLKEIFAGNANTFNQSYLQGKISEFKGLSSELREMHSDNEKIANEITKFHQQLEKDLEGYTKVTLESSNDLFYDLILNFKENLE